MSWHRLSVLAVCLALAGALPAGAGASAGASSAECDESLQLLDSRLAGLADDESLRTVLETVQVTSGRACGFDLFEPADASSAGDRQTGQALAALLSDTVGDCPGAGALGQNFLLITRDGQTAFDWAETSTGYIGKEHVQGTGPIVVEGNGPITSLHVRWWNGVIDYAVARVGGVVVPMSDPSGDVICGSAHVDVPNGPDAWIHQACDGWARAKLLTVSGVTGGSDQGDSADQGSDVEVAMRAGIVKLGLEMRTELRNAAVCEVPQG